MNINYLEMLPVSNIVKYSKSKTGGVEFIGYPRTHPSDKNKFILVNDPLGLEPAVLEFKLEDILNAEEVPSAVTEDGEGVPLIKLWIRQHAIGMLLQPFEVKERKGRKSSNISSDLAEKIKVLQNPSMNWE